MRKRLTRIVTVLLALVTVLSLLPAPAAEAASLKKGSRGTQVKQLQQNLIGLGFLGDYIALADAAWLDRLIHPGFDLAWACYLTAQALLAISLLPRRIRARLP